MTRHNSFGDSRKGDVVNRIVVNERRASSPTVVDLDEKPESEKESHGECGVDVVNDVVGAHGGERR